MREQDADVVLRITSDFANSWDKGEPAQVELIYDASQRDASTAVARLHSLLDNINRRTGALRLVARGLSPTVMQTARHRRTRPVHARRAAPAACSRCCRTSSSSAASSAAWRWRSTRPPASANASRWSRCSPTRCARWQILVGKLGATTAFAITTVLLSILAFAVVGQFMPTEKIGMTLTIGAGFVASTIFVMLPLVLVLATLQTLVAAFAKSYREAQTYISLLMFVPVVPTMMLSLMPFKTLFWMYAVPLMSQQIVITRLLRGDSVPRRRSPCASPARRSPRC